MGACLVKKDYRAFLKYTHPTILEISGGTERMLEAMKQANDNSSGAKITSVTIGEPSKMVSFKNTFQCVIPQTIEAQTAQGPKTIKSSLIGVSFNNGKTWSFIDARDKDLNTLKVVVPDLSDELVLPRD